MLSQKGNLHTTSKHRFVKPHFWYQIPNFPQKIGQTLTKKHHLRGKQTHHSYGFGHIHQGHHSSPTPSPSASFEDMTIEDLL